VSTVTHCRAITSYNRPDYTPADYTKVYYGLGQFVPLVYIMT